MPGLLDIAPSSEIVVVRGIAVDVTGVSAHGFVGLMQRFPDLRRIMTGNEVTAESLMAVAGDAVAAIIAAGTGAPGNAEAEAVAARLSVDDQASLLTAVFRQTFPMGVGPFAEKVGALTGSLGGAALPVAPASK
jgi:hypothetical protein